MNSKNAVRIVLVLVLAAGTLIRGFSGKALLSADLVYASDKKEPYPGTRNPAAAVKTFYMLIDEGQFDKAWEISKEPLWLPEGTKVGYADAVSENGIASEGGAAAVGGSGFFGFTSREWFSKRGVAELGFGGSWVRLSNIKARLCDECAPSFPEDVMLALAPDAVYEVEATGHLIGACTIFRWTKIVPVVEKNGGYYLILPGIKRAKTFYYQAWFDSIEKIASLRSSP